MIKIISLLLAVVLFNLSSSFAETLDLGEHGTLEITVPEGW